MITLRYAQSKISEGEIGNFGVRWTVRCRRPCCGAMTDYLTDSRMGSLPFMKLKRYLQVPSTPLRQGRELVQGEHVPIELACDS